jgi:class 3 adenylate cyclase
MATIQATVILKTDICGFTARVEALSESELGYLLDQHKRLILEAASDHGGMTVKGEGDSFWIIFPSVSAATNAAVDMQQNLRTAQTGKSDDERLAIRIAIGLGDVLHQDNDIFGDAVNQAARIESVTPADEIYLSQAAWLALNKAEVQTSYVSDFVLKGIKEPVLVYKVERQQKTRIIKNCAIVFVDMSGIARFWNSHPIEDSENLVVRLDDLIKNVCEKAGGSVHQIVGDSYFLTFPKVIPALAGIAHLARQWNELIQQSNIDCSLYVGIHKGDINILRSHVFGDDISVAASLAYQRSLPAGSGGILVLASSKIASEVKDTEWGQHFKKINSSEGEIFRLTISPQAPLQTV